MYCSKCGKENEDDAEFCKHCGAKIGVEGEKPDTQAEPSEETKEPTIEEKHEEPKAPLEKKKPRRKLAVILIVIGIILVSVLVWYIIAYENANEHIYYTYDPDTAPDSLTVEIEMNGGGIEINFTSNLADPVVYIDYHKRWEGAVISQPSFSSSSTKVSFDSGTVWGESDSELTITLRSDVTFSFDTKTSNGGMNLVSDSPGITFGTFTLDTLNGASNLFISHASVSGKIESTTENGATNYHFTNCTLNYIDTTTTSGASNIFLENCIIGNIKSNVNSGGMAISSKDITITSDSTWTLNAERGGIGLNINQTKSMGADVTVNGDIEGRGDITSSFEGNAIFVRAKFTASASEGSATLANGAGFNAPGPGAMESSNYGNEALDQFDIDLSAEDGDIEVDAVNS
jgi:DNA-directed RNA polymerase subunit RPC12/RpoP